MIFAPEETLRFLASLDGGGEVVLTHIRASCSAERPRE
jgi:hypothetical protein